MATTTDAADRVELRPFREQEPFLQRDKKYYGYISGVGAGKTAAGVLRTALNVEEWNPGEMGAIVAPTTTMIKDVILPLMREFNLLDYWEYKSAHTDEPGIHAPNGARVLLLSADNRRTIERLAGLNLSWWWLDEASRVSPRAHEILTQRLRVGSYRNGYLTTTPMGRDYVYDEFVGDHEHDGEWREHGEADVFETSDRLALTRVPTWANPFTADDYKEQMEAKEGQVYEREILGRFVDYEGLVYSWFGEENILTMEAARKARKQVRSYIYGVDWGTNNPSAIVAIGLTNEGPVVFDEYYDPVPTYGDLADTAAAMQEEYRPGRFYCDPSEPSGIEEFKRAGLDAVGAENDVVPGIKAVNAEADDLRVHERCQNIINEFGLYRYKEDSTDDDPVSANDHALDALRYALYSHDAGEHAHAMAGVARY